MASARSDKILESSFEFAIKAVAEERDKKMAEYAQMIELLHKKLDEHRATMPEYARAVDKR